MKALKTPKQITLGEYLDTPRLIGCHEMREIIKAYSDCLEFVKLEKETRNLDYFCKKALTIKQLEKIMPLAIPNGYNNFDAIASIQLVADAFDEDAEIFVAREGSPCLYIKPGKGNLWLDKLKNLETHKNGPDEILFEGSLGMFRLWWD